MEKKYLWLLLSLIYFESYSQCWQTMSMATYHIAAVKPDGTLWAWGKNSQGQLGDGTTTSRNVPVQIGVANDWQAVSASLGNGLALKTNGTIWAWGSNYNGHLGNNGSTTQSYVPVQVGVSNDWKFISSGLFSNAAIKTDGTLWVWGRNEQYGQLGDGTMTNRFTPIQIGTDHNWKYIDVGSTHAMAIKTDGTLWGWGYNGYGQLGKGDTLNSYFPVQIGTATNWKSVFTGDYHTIALKTDGTIWTAGIGLDGELGNGSFSPQSETLTQAGTDTDWESISAGRFNSFGIKTNGTLWACGENIFGMLGDATTENRNTFTQVGTYTDWAFVDSNHITSVGIREDNSVWFWGSNSYAQFGNGTGGNESLSDFSSTVPFYVSCGNLTIGDQNEPAFSLFPNPVQSQLNVVFPSDVTIKSLKVTDMLGKIILEQTDNSGSINVQHLAKGIYLLVIDTDEKTFKRKFIKQ